MSSRIVIKYNNFGKLASKLPQAVSLIVRKTAEDIEANAKTVVPVDTGKLKNSITSEFPSLTKAIVAPHTDYAAYVEYGTRKMRARPYMRPSAEVIAPVFIEACKRLEEKLR